MDISGGVKGTDKKGSVQWWTPSNWWKLEHTLKVARKLGGCHGVVIEVPRSTLFCFCKKCKGKEIKLETLFEQTQFLFLTFRGQDNRIRGKVCRSHEHAPLPNLPTPTTLRPPPHLPLIPPPR